MTIINTNLLRYASLIIFLVHNIGILRPGKFFCPLVPMLSHTFSAFQMVGLKDMELLLSSFGSGVSLKNMTWLSEKTLTCYKQFEL